MRSKTMNKNARKIKFHQGFAEYQSIYAYIVYAYTDDYNANRVRLLVTSSYEKAIAFINKNFFNSDNFLTSQDLSRNGNTWTVTKDIDKDMQYKITSETKYLDARELYIECDTENYIQNKKGEIAKLSDFSYPDEFVWNEEI